MTQMTTKKMPDKTIEGNISQKAGESPLPASLQRPLVPSLTRMLAGRALTEEILDPDNPNLIMDRDR